MKQEQQNIDGQFEKKRKGSEVAQKMYVSSGFLNNSFALGGCCEQPSLSAVPSRRRTTSRD